MTVLFPPLMLPVCDFASHASLQMPIAQMRPSLFWVESPLNMLNFGILPTSWEATLEQEILHCGYGICLCNCMFGYSSDMISSLPAQCNLSPINTCSGVATSHPIFIL